MSFLFKKKQPKQYSIEFMTLCYEDGSVEELDMMYDKCVKDNKIEEIKDCKDAKGNLPIHKAAKHGNFRALRWIFKKFNDLGWDLDVNAPDEAGRSPAILCCLYGYRNGSEVSAPKLKET